tara:strand:- start:52642 stop:52827 length:186 start_codon:yes stop_codon:yes gene_type:complete
MGRSQFFILAFNCFAVKKPISWAIETNDTLNLLLGLAFEKHKIMISSFNHNLMSVMLGLSI